MTPKKKEEEIQFDFGAGDLIEDDDGKVPCDICYNRFPYPEVEIMLRGYTVCPDCVLAGPAAVAAEVKRTAGSKDRLAQRDEDPDDQREIAADLRVLVKQLRRVDSFENIPGGAVAVAIARVTAKDGPRQGEKAA